MFRSAGLPGSGRPAEHRCITLLVRDTADPTPRGHNRQLTFPFSASKDARAPRVPEMTASRNAGVLAFGLATLPHVPQSTSASVGTLARRGKRAGLDGARLTLLELAALLPTLAVQL